MEEINKLNISFDIMKKVKRSRKTTSARRATGNKNVIRKIGDDGGYLVNQCPVLIPKENMKMFTAMQKSCTRNPYGNYGNALNVKLY